MDVLIYAAVAFQVAQRSYHIVNSLTQTMPKPSRPIVIELTSSEGCTTSKEIIAPNAPQTTTTTSEPSFLDYVADLFHTAWLFTYSDVKSAFIPMVLFGVGHALSIAYFDESLSQSTFQVLSRIPLVMAWVWFTFLPFDISNQRQPNSITEDAANKPWRPLPAGLITSGDARNMMIAGYIASFSFSLRYGGVGPALALALHAFLYNDMGGSNKSWVSRHLLNGFAFIACGSGAAEVALGGHGFSYSPALVQWLRIIVLIVCTGIQTADLPDQEGDASAGRRTLPLIIGDKATRYITAISVLAWSLFCPFYWQLNVGGYILPVLGAAVVAQRTLMKRTVDDDDKTYKIWNLWLVAIYCLPLAKVISTAIAA